MLINNSKVEIVLVDGESNEELDRHTIDVKDLDSYDIGWAYKHDHEYAKWSGWVLGSDYDNDQISLTQFRKEYNPC
jgi:hypothetical protein|tara:strand:+ start:304 stop:531 length:228 start_codon:yes stop_codon:yes gene_type:complete